MPKLPRVSGQKATAALLRAVVTIIASAILGALCGFFAWIAIWMLALHEFMRYVHAQEEMAAAAGIGPSHGALLVLMIVGGLASGFFGWRLSMRRQAEARALASD